MMSEFNSLDYQFMNEAIKLALNGLFTTDPNPRVGCVLVKNGTIVGKGWHYKAGEPHAEIHALRNAGERAKGATAYISLEPCNHHGKTPPCCNALIDAGVKEVVAAMQDPNPKVAGNGLKMLEQAGVPTRCGLMEAQSKKLNPGFIKRMTKGLPFVRCKIAMSLDGRTCMQNGESKWITGTAARQDAHRIRARSSAIMTGIGTILADDPNLTARIVDTDLKQPALFILDRKLAIPESSKVLSAGKPVTIFTTSQDKAKIERINDMGSHVVNLPEIDLKTVLTYLSNIEINELLLEAGPILTGAMTKARLIDEYIIYQAPVIMGTSARGAFELNDINSMNERIFLDIIDTRHIGQDIKITAIITEK